MLFLNVGRPTRTSNAIFGAKFSAKIRTEIR